MMFRTILEIKGKHAILDWHMNVGLIHISECWMHPHMNAVNVVRTCTYLNRKMQLMVSNANANNGI